MPTDAPAVYGRPSLLSLIFPLLYCAFRVHLPEKSLALTFLSHVYFSGGTEPTTRPSPHVLHTQESQVPLSEVLRPVLYASVLYTAH